MVISISNAFIEQFADMVRHLAQQGDTRIRPHVYEVPGSGEAYNFDRLAESDAVEKTTSRTVTPFVDPVWSRRVATPKTFQWADTVENADKVQMLIDPQSAYAVNGAMSMRRSIDDILIAAATADAVDGDGTPVVFPPSQTVGIAGSSVLGLNLDLVTQVNEIFQTNDVDPDEPKIWVTNPTAVREMLNDPTLTNSDYMAVKALSANGMFPNFMGFTWVLSNRLTLDAGGEPSVANLAFTKRALGLMVNNDIFVRIAERPDLSHLIQVYMEFTMGATRVEDEHIVAIHLDQDYVPPV